MILTTCAGCQTSYHFDLDFGSGDNNLPRTDHEFDADDSKFTFALFSDLTGGERTDVFAKAVRQLNVLRPTLIMNVGDLIEGGVEDAVEIKQQWDSFDKRANQAIAPVYYVGGNHDLTNLLMREVWETRYGARYYHFIYSNVLFVVLDTEDYPPDRLEEINGLLIEAMKVVEVGGWGAFPETQYANLAEEKTGEVGPAQADYVRSVLDANPNVRWTFLFAHKPVWRSKTDKQFSKIEAALADRPYTVFAGHEHAYRYEQRLGRDYIQLGTTGGVQFEALPGSIDHVTLVSVSDVGVDIANIKMSGIFSKLGETF